MEQFNNRKGFTLIELLATVALLGILAGGILMVLNIPELLTKANIRVYKSALTLSQIQHLYAQGLIKQAVAFDL